MSIVKVAKRAGVSVTTVSLVMNGKPNVSPATAQLVREAMQELGYTPRPPEHRPGPRTSTKPSTRIGRIALVVWHMPEDALRAPVYLDVLQGVESALHERKLGMMLHQVSANDEDVTDTLRGTVDGLLLLGRKAQDFGTAVRRFPCVRIMGSLEKDDWCDHISYRNEAIGPLAADYLLQRGHKVCAYVGPSDWKGFWSERARTFRDTVEEAGKTAVLFEQKGLPQVGVNNHASYRAWMRATLDSLLASNPRPTGLFLPADAMTASAYFTLLERGVKIGKDIEIVSCNNERPLLDPLHPRPAVVDIHARDIGHRAVEHLLWRIENPQALRANIQIDPTLVTNEIAVRETEVAALPGT